MHKKKDFVCSRCVFTNQVAFCTSYYLLILPNPHPSRNQTILDLHGPYKAPGIQQKSRDQGDNNRGRKESPKEQQSSTFGTLKQQFLAGIFEG